MVCSKDMVKDKQNGKKARNMTENGKKICKTVKASKPKKTARSTKDNSTMAKNKDMESTGGQTKRYLKVSGTTIK